MEKSAIITEDQLNLMHILQQKQIASQRLIAKESGLSIGKENYYTKALIQIGFVKIQRFTNSNKKAKYFYVLTPKGIYKKTSTLKQFIPKKQPEFDKLNTYFNI